MSTWTPRDQLDLEELQKRYRREQNRQRVIANAELMAAEAREDGFVLTIETKPRKPLAMGHYDIVVNVRPARVLDEPIVRQP